MTEAELDAYLTRARPGYTTMTPAQQQLIKQQYMAQQQVAGQTPSATGQAAQVGTAVAVNQGANAALGSVPAAAPGSVGGMSTGTGGGMSMAGSSQAAMGATPLYVPAAALAGTYLAGKSIKNTLSGEEDNSTSGKVGRGQAAISTGGFSEVAKFAGIGGGKNKDQQGRDDYRSRLKDAGIYDNDYNLELTDGSKVNMGLDGSVKNYNVDFSKEGIGNVVSYVNPLAYIVTGGDQKKASDLAGELTNAIYNSKDQAAEARALYQKFGVTKQQALDMISKMDVDDQTKKVFSGTINQLGIPDAPQSQDQQNMAAQSDQLAKIRASTAGFIQKLNSSNAAAQKQAAQQNAQAAANANKSTMLNRLLNQAASSAATPIAFPTPTQSANPTNPGADFSGALNNILQRR